MPIHNQEEKLRREATMNTRTIADRIAAALAAPKTAAGDMQGRLQIADLLADLAAEHASEDAWLTARDLNSYPDTTQHAA